MRMRAREGMGRTGPALFVVLVALFLSGVASILNQVVWQRALKVFLGGSEAIAAMVVVLVFMLGLGIGSGLAGARARRVANPLRAFGGVELGLFAVNAAIACVLGFDLADSVYAAQRLALAAGIPLRLVYAVAALALLLPPTILMGATLPLAAEACQRQLGATESKLITLLLALNTAGACVGALGSSFLLLPYFGQRVALGVAALFNLAAGAVVVLLARRARWRDVRSASTEIAVSTSAARRRPISLEERTGFVLGFLSLGYEMFLLRLVALAHEPRPYTFALTLLFFLLFWSIGVALAGRTKDRSLATLALCALLVALMPELYSLDRFRVHFALYRGGLLYFLPCIAFGALYGTLVSRAASAWGRDVGRFYALNTLGSCVGILFFSLVGYEIPQASNAWLIALGLAGVLFGIAPARSPRAATASVARGLRVAQGALAVAALGLLGSGLTLPFSDDGRMRSFWGRDGVIEIGRDGQLWIDGLWHSRLSDGKSHIGNPYNWMMAVAGVLAHGDRPIGNALVVGNGIGLTATTLTRVPGVEVDAYEINRTFAELLALFPARTLESGTNPRIHLRWMDGRSGLALDPKRYDLIVSAPLHLRAAGSSNLLSREYLRLARSRLAPGGVLVLYSAEGAPEKGEIVRATVRSVFASVETFWDGTITVASDGLIEITEASIRARIERGDALAREMSAFDRKVRREHAGGLYALFDAKRLPTRESPYLVTDDHPIVEYPDVAARLLNAWAPPVGAAIESRAGADPVFR